MIGQGDRSGVLKQKNAKNVHYRSSLGPTLGNDDLKQTILDTEVNLF